MVPATIYSTAYIFKEILLKKQSNHEKTLERNRSEDEMMKNRNHT